MASYIFLSSARCEIHLYSFSQFYPKSIQVIHEKFRQEDEEIFRQNMFKVRREFVSVNVWRIVKY